MHQGWPKFTQNLWYATADKGMAALVYSPSVVRAKVADGQTVEIREETFYPMDDRINFSFHLLENKKKGVTFPLHLRIPAWCREARIEINGKLLKTAGGNRIEVITRHWKEEDQLTLVLPMRVTTDTWYENSIAVERGPLVYALKIGEKWEKKKVEEHQEKFREILL